MKRLATLALASTLCIPFLVGSPATRVLGDGSGPPAAPAGLAMSLQNAGTVAAGRWISSSRIELTFQVQVGAVPVTPQVELEPAGTAFNGKQNFTGSPLTASGKAQVTATGLKNGSTYHWQARVVDSTGITSPWTAFSTPASVAFDFGIDRDPPTRPTVTSPTNPDQNRWYHNRVVRLHWSSKDSLSGVQGYSYVLERKAHVIPPGSITSGNTLSLSHLADGVWFVALRSVDAAGNWSPTATFRVQLDRQAPRISWLSPRTITFNPYRGSTSVRFGVSKAAAVTLNLYRIGSYKPVQTFTFRSVLPGHPQSIWWSGKDRSGHLVGRGYYFFSAVATDRASNVVRVTLGGINVDPERATMSPSGQPLYAGDGKRIIVSLSRQMLYAYDGRHLEVQTVVTTGNPNLPTPLGNFTVLAKYHPFEFISPWPPGSPYYYPPSLSQYALLFRDGGYFLHDAPWREVFGPGSNGPGQPGTNYGGTHGCVNIPSGPMVFLFNWASVGTPVEVVP